VQGLELILLSTGILVAVAQIVSQFLDRGAADHPMSRLLLGLVPAVIGVMLVAIAQTDVVPDDLERPLWVIAVVLISATLVLGTSYRLARH
jgi:hypothetical protein